MKPHTNDMDHEWQHRLQADSKAAFEAVYRQHFVTVFHFAKRFVHDSQQAEDVTTEAFIKLWERFGQFTSLQGVKSFLFTAAKNACLNLARSEARAHHREADYAYLESLSAEDWADQEDIIAQVYQYIFDEIEKLPAQEKKVFRMAFLEGLNNEAIAQQLGITNQSVRNHKARALKTLRLAVLAHGSFACYLLWLWLASRGE